MSVADEVKDRLDIVEVVSSYVALQKAGRNLKALCPFHSEKTPSFVVNPDRQSWRCFGACATGGDAITFVMRREGMGFGEALRLLAERAGIALSEGRDRGRTDRLHRVNELAASFYQDVLGSADGQRVEAYLKERGLDPTTVKAFRLGLSPRGGDGLRSYFAAHEVDLDLAIEAGLLRQVEGGGVRDFFWGRLMFPIWDRRGRVAGFGARELDGSDPKYINTPATSLFDKRSTLYSLHMATAAARQDNRIVVVEGYMDVIAAHQHGYANVVASMGTALTEQQVARLKSVTSNFVLALDPDAAGQEATLRSLDASWRALEGRQVAYGRGAVGPLYQREQLNLRIALLPEGSDPDKLIRSSPERWETLIKDAVPYVDYVIQALPTRYHLDTSDGKAQAAEAVRPLITMARNAFEQEATLRKLARTLDVGTDMLKAAMGTPRPSPNRRRQASASAQSSVAATSLAPRSEHFLEDYTLALLLHRPELKGRAESLPPEHFHRSEDREVFTCWMGCTTMEELQVRLDESLRAHVEYVTSMDLTPIDRSTAEGALDQCLRRLEERHLQELQETMLLTGDSDLPPPKDVEEAIANVNTRLKQLFSRPT